MLLLVAVTMSAIRLHPDLNKIVQTQIENYLSQAINTHAEIARLEISRSHPFSVLIAEQVSFTSNNNESWGLDRVEVRVDILSSLFNQQIIIKQVALIGLDLLLHRNSDGEIAISKQFLVPPQANQSSQNLSSIDLNLIDAKIHVKDDVTNVDYHFSGVNAHIKPGLISTNFFLQGELPEHLGQSFTLKASVAGDLSDFNQAKVKFYVQAEEMVFDELLANIPQQKDLDINAVFNAEAWGEFNQGIIQSMQGSLHMSHGTSQKTDDKERSNQQLCMSDQVVEGLALDYELSKTQDEWTLLTNNLVLFYDTQNDANELDPQQVGIKVALSSHQPTSFSMFASEIPLGVLCNTINRYNPDWLSQQLDNYRGDASIRNLQLHWQKNKNHDQYEYAADFSKASFLEVNTNRKITGLTGSLRGGDSGGVASLTSEQVKLVLPQLYPNKDLLVSMQGDWHWQHGKHQHLFQTDLLHVQNEELDVNTRVAGFVQSGELYIDSQLFIKHFDAIQVSSYFPVVQKVKRVKSWFSGAIKEGVVRDSVLQLRGKLSDFPYQNSTGVLSADVTAYETVLEYMQGWPKFTDIQATITMDKDRIEVTPQTAKMYDSKLTQAKLVIPSFLQAVLDGQGTLEGDGQNLIHFLADSGLVEKKNSVADQISLQGNTQLELAFTKSLTEKNPLPFEVSGEIGFDDNTLNIHAVQLALSKVDGAVSFDQEGAQADQLSATLYEQPIILSARALGDGASELLFTGEFALNEYLQQQYPHFMPFLSGQTDIHGKLHLPSMFKKDNPEKVALNIHSSLKGVEFDLPYPLVKPSATQLDAHLMFDQKQQVMRWQFADKAALLFTMSEQQPFNLNIIELGPPNKDIKTEHQGLLVRGKIDRLPVDEWMTFINRHGIQSLDQETSYDGINLPQLDLMIEQVEWSSWPTQNVNLQAHTDGQQYTIDLASSLGDGQIRLPLLGDSPLMFDMQTFTVPARDKSIQQVIDPRSFPPFVFTADKFLVRNKPLTNIMVVGEPIHDGLQFSQIEFGLVDLDAQGNGSWRQMDDGAVWSQFNVDMQTTDLADALESLGFESGLRNGNGDIKAQFTWPNAPHKLNLAEIIGSGSIDINDGSVVEVDPGAARLLALFNLSALTRRLSLDFKDVTAKGFAFNKIHGDLKLQSGGDLNMDKITVDSSAAVIEFSGTTNIVQQSYDQKVAVTPSVTDSLPAAGALVGGPIGAAAGFVVDKVAKVVGLNKALTYHYTMTGTWEQPNIEKVVRKTEEADQDQ